MGIERRHHAVDRTLDELGIIGLFDIVGPDSLEHVAKQVQLCIGVGAGGGLGSRDPGLAPWSVHEKGEARTGYRAEEKDGILAHCSRTFSLSVACACRKSNPDILVVQPAENWAAKNVPGPLDGARDWRILLQG